MPIDKFDPSVIEDSLSKTYDTSNPFNQEVAYKPFERYKGYKVDLSLSPDELENDLSKQQSYWDRLSNDLTVTGANAAAMFGSVFLSTKDLLTGDFSLDGSQSESQEELFNWRKSVEENNINFESNYDKENPILAMLLPTALTGFKSTKGWGELMKSGAYGIGAISAIALQEMAITAATYGTGTIPSLAVNVAKLLRLPKDVANIGKSMLTNLNNLKNLQQQYNALNTGIKALNTAKSFQLGKEASKFLARGLAASYGEASFEGLEAKENLTQKLTEEIKSKYGRNPTGEELVEIEQKAQEAASMRYYANMGLLTLTGGYEIGQIFKPKSTIKDLVDEGSHLGLKKVFSPDGMVKFDKDVFMLKPNKIFDSKGGSILKSSIENVGKLTKTLQKADFALMEGVEEFSQLWIDKSAENHYVGRFNKDVNTTVLNSILSGLDQSVNKDGFIAALSGIMGGTMQSLAFKGIPTAAQRIFNKKGITSKKERLEAFNKKVDSINEVLKNTDIQELVKSVDTKSFNGTLSDKIRNTENQTYLQFLNNLNPKSNITTESLATFHQISNFASNGLGDIYYQYLEKQIDDTFDDMNQKSELKNHFKTEIEKVSKIYEVLNNSFPNPYVKSKKNPGDPYKYKRYQSWKDHVASYMYLENKYKGALENISDDDIKDSDVIFDVKSFKDNLKKDIKVNKNSLKVFEVGVELTENQKEQKKKLKTETEDLEELLKLAEENNEEIFSKLLEKRKGDLLDLGFAVQLSSSSLRKKLVDVAQLRFSLANVSQAYRDLINVESAEDIVKKDEKLEEEAKKINKKLEEEVTEKPKEVEKPKPIVETSKEVEEKSSPINTKVEEEKSPVSVENKKKKVIPSSTKTIEGASSDIRSKFITGIFTLVEKDGNWELDLDENGKVKSYPDKDKIVFIEKLKNGNFYLDQTDLNNYQIVKVVTLKDQELRQFPYEPGLVSNSSPSYHYSLIEKGSKNPEEIIRIQSPDSILINPNMVDDYKKIGLEVNEDTNIYELAQLIKKTPNINHTSVLQIIHGKVSDSQLSLDTWADYTIAHFERIERLVKNRNENEIFENLSNYFAATPHITEMRSESTETFKANNIPFHYANGEKELYKKPIAIKNGNSIEVYALNTNGDVVNITDKIKINLNVKNENTSNYFAVVPSISFDGVVTHNTVPLLRSTYEDITENIVEAFNNEGEEGVRKLFREEVYIKTSELDGNPNIFVSRKDNLLTVDINQPLPDGKSKNVAKLKITKNEDNSYSLENTKNIGLYPKVSDALNIYPTLISPVYEVKKPYKNYRIKLVPIQIQVEDKKIETPVTEEITDENFLDVAEIAQPEENVVEGVKEVKNIPEEKPVVEPEKVEEIKNDDIQIEELPYDLNDLTLTKQFEILDKNKINPILAKSSKKETLVKVVQNALKKNLIREVKDTPNERNLNTLTLDINKQIDYHLNICHGLS